MNTQSTDKTKLGWGDPLEYGALLRTRQKVCLRDLGVALTAEGIFIIVEQNELYTL